MSEVKRKVRSINDRDRTKIRTIFEMDRLWIEDQNEARSHMVEGFIYAMLNKVDTKEVFEYMENILNLNITDDDFEISGVYCRRMRKAMEAVQRELEMVALFESKGITGST